MSENIRHHYLTKAYLAHYERTTPHSLGREGLYYDKCQSSYRPKFICAKKGCRRSIKPTYDPDQNEYRISETQDWDVRPLRGTNKEFDEACRNGKRIDSSSEAVKNHPDSEWQKRQALIQKFGNVISWDLYGNYFGDDRTEVKMEEAEMEYLRRTDPDTWWLQIIRSGANLMRCPSCGDGVLRVGSNFRIPAQSDEKAWKETQAMIEAGEDMVSRFSTCTTVGQHKEMVDEAMRLQSLENNSVAWQEEKRRRIQALGLAPKPISDI